MSGLVGKYAACAATYLTLLTLDATAASCRRFPKETQSAIKAHVAALQRYEREASDRLKGLDSRPFEFLRGEAKKIVAIIGEPKALADEEDLQRCRNATRPIRKLCTEAALMFLEILENHAIDSKLKHDAPRYAAAIAECEKLMDLKPLKSAFRGTE
ncbi:MAG: hypothetical protein E6G97_17360 [Alphaproteobacteria bacterium]|nr:MAG: hypothetical protein E6G97_17360 [Alphaproteobacteria bacterium]